MCSSILFISTFVHLFHQDAAAADAIDWGDGEPAPVEIEIVDAGTDCEDLSYHSFLISILFIAVQISLKIFVSSCRS